MTNGRRGFASPRSAGDRDLCEQKRELRRAAKARRAAAHARSGAAAGAPVRDRFAAAIRLAPGAAVAGYTPIGDEFDVLPLLCHLHHAGHPCALPVVIGRDAPLGFRAGTPDTALQPGPVGVGPPGAAAPAVRPAVVLVPMLAFDRAGHRIGYGAGYYDRTLAGLRGDGAVVAVGVAFADQEVTDLPAGPRDQALDWIVTERAAFRPQGPHGPGLRLG